MNLAYLPISVLYPDASCNRMIMREIKEPESMQFYDEESANLMKHELEKCGLLITKKKVKMRSKDVSIFFDSGQMFLLDIYPPEIDLDSLSVVQLAAFNVDMDPKELPESEENIDEFLKK